MVLIPQNSTDTEEVKTEGEVPVEGASPNPVEGGEIDNKQESDKLVNWDKVPVVRDIRNVSTNVKKNKGFFAGLFASMGTGIFLIAIVAFWFNSEKSLDAVEDLAGRDRIIVSDKGETAECTYVVGKDKAKWCVDSTSYDMAEVGVEYKITKMNYDYKLKELQSWEISK